jgi:hypothetical protein
MKRSFSARGDLCATLLAAGTVWIRQINAKDCILPGMEV